MQEIDLKREFRNPGSEWRGAPFWSWNDDLDPAELRRQVRLMKRAGLGGFFMHNRIGLVTPFMSERWMECIAAAVDEARKQGMQAWLYDEDRWPSGFGGGLVVGGNPDFGMKYLELRDDGEGQYRFAVKREGGEIAAYRPLPAQGRLRPGEQMQSFQAAIAPPSAWFNERPYADNLNPESVQRFLDICYDPYRKRFQGEFGKTIPGIFTDEPNVFSLHNLPRGRRVPWTWRLPEEFRARRGYDLTARLPELFGNQPRFSRTRHDFWRTVTELFAEAYCRQLAQWCEHNGLELTGHMLCEQEFDQQIPVGGAAMPSLEYMQRPGIDILTEQVRETLTCKQASSIAHQLGRRRTLSETYGCSGWHFTFEGQKWSGDWQTVLGINTRCQHLTPYSMRGMRKRDYPPAFFYCQPWWRYFRVVEDYFARATFISSLGEPVQEVLLLHNISTAWGDAPDDATRRRHGDHLLQVAEDLLALHYDFDLGDEVVMARHGAVKRQRLLVGKAAYRLVVIPESVSLFRSTAALLREFLAAGGRVIAMRRRPTHLEGEPAPELDDLFAHPGVTLIAPTQDELEDALRTNLARRISITAGGPRELGSVIYQERRHRGRSYFLLANRDREAGCRLSVALPAEGYVEQWDLEHGRTRPLPAHCAGGRTFLEVEMPPTGSLALVFDPRRRPGPSRRRAPEAVVRTLLPDAWQVRRTTENSLPLDRCRWRFAGGQWSDPIPVWLAQRQIRTEMGLEDISHSNIAQPWVRYAQPSPHPPRRVELCFRFSVDRLPPGNLDLVVESAELFHLSVNGQPVAIRRRGWWLEKSMDRVPLAHVRRGENELVLACDYRDAPEYELEECYLIGDFGVDRQRDAIGAEPGMLRAGDWCDQGYPYYVGNLRYGQRVRYRPRAGERVLLKVGPHAATCLAVHVNGRLAGVRGWAPYEVDITRWLRPGDNLLEIEVCGSPRNLLGPNHLPEKRPAGTGPGSFIALDRWVEKRNLVPYGLLGEVWLERRCEAR